jgi:hypothetical protein
LWLILDPKGAIQGLVQNNFDFGATESGAKTDNPQRGLKRRRKMATMNVQMSNDSPKEGEPENVTEDPQEQKEEQPYLGSWKTKEAAEEGFGNMKKLLDQQGNELGTLRKQADFFQKQMSSMQGQQQQAQQPQEPQGPDYSKELKAVEKQMQELDPDEPDYNREFAKLFAQSNQIVAQSATQQALSAAQEEFKRALDERDVQAMHKDFYKDNPDFNTPDMQMRIQEYLGQDQTGMSDPVVAYREIQRDDAMAKIAEYEQAIAEKDRLLSLKKGEESTGKVVTKGQSTQQQTQKQSKARGADLDKGMREVLQNMGAA